MRVPLKLVVSVKAPPGPVVATGALVACRRTCAPTIGLLSWSSTTPDTSASSGAARLARATTAAGVRLRRRGRWTTGHLAEAARFYLRVAGRGGAGLG